MTILEDRSQRWQGQGGPPEWAAAWERTRDLLGPRWPDPHFAYEHDPDTGELADGAGGLATALYIVARERNVPVADVHRLDVEELVSPKAAAQARDPAALGSPAAAARAQPGGHSRPSRHPMAHPAVRPPGAPARRGLQHHAARPWSPGRPGVRPVTAHGPAVLIRVERSVRDFIAPGPPHTVVRYLGSWRRTCTRQDRWTPRPRSTCPARGRRLAGYGSAPGLRARAHGASPCPVTRLHRRDGVGGLPQRSQ